jgi:hypothetical protein
LPRQQLANQLNLSRKQKKKLERWCCKVADAAAEKALPNKSEIRHLKQNKPQRRALFAKDKERERFSCCFSEGASAEKVGGT